MSLNLKSINQDPIFEHHYIELKGDHQSVVLGSIYRPPNTNLDRFMEEYKDSLEQLGNLKNKELVLGMDHNINLLKHDVHQKTQEFIELNLDVGLLPVITKLTRVRTNSATLIDSIFDKLHKVINCNIPLVQEC